MGDRWDEFISSEVMIFIVNGSHDHYFRNEFTRSRLDRHYLEDQLFFKIHTIHIINKMLSAKQAETDLFYERRLGRPGSAGNPVLSFRGSVCEN